MQNRWENCKTSIRRFDSDRRLSKPQQLRASFVEAFFSLGKIFGKNSRRVPMNRPGESEWKTRKRRIDLKLEASGWWLAAAGEIPNSQPHRTEEEETSAGPADYALWLDSRIVGLVEAKKLTLGPQNVLTQAERYGRGLRQTGYNFDGCRCPFLYSTNGEIIWFHDVRHRLNRSRSVARFHTPAGLAELLTRDFNVVSDKLLALPHDHTMLRPYQREANAAVDRAIADRRRNLW